MVGGTVIECCDHPTDRSRIYINCANRGKNQKRADECAIYVARNQDSEQIEIGDSIWARLVGDVDSAEKPSEFRRCGESFIEVWR